MFKLLFFVLSLFLFLHSSTSLYSISVTASDDSTLINLNAYQGKKILFVNTASNSAYSFQYNNLEQLYQQFKDNLVIIALPSNSFGNEPESDSAISALINADFHISFPLAAKGDVSGNNRQTIYTWLQEENNNGVMSSTIKGDFQKYLVDENGNLIGVFAPSVDPLSDELVSVIRGQ